MADVDQHVVFFECHNLRAEQRRRIQLYFQNRRRSGGGECGVVRRVNDTVFSIAFTHRKDQQRVLQRSRHELADVSLVLTVRDGAEPHTSSTITSSDPGHDFTAQSQTPEPAPVSTPPPSGEEHELQPDTPLLHNLNESPKAWNKLEKELSSVACSAQMYAEEGQIVVRKSDHHVAAAEDRNWKSEMDLHRAKSLHEPQATDEEKVCTEDRMAVVDKEKLVSDMSPYLLGYLKNAYGGPGVLREVLGMSEEVAIELRDTDLHLSAHSADKLDETAKILQGEFKDVRCDVTNCSAVLPELLKKLTLKTDEMNQRQCRAQVVFIPDSTVCLLGHTKEVEELSETVKQFIWDQNTVHLPFPAQELPEVLHQHGFDYSGVVFNRVTSSAEHMVVLEGPPSKVAEVKNRLGPFLASVIEDKVTTDATGAVHFFRKASGKDKLPSVDNTLAQDHCHTTTQSLSDGNTVVASYSLCGGLQVLVCQGDITKLDADALVNAANEDLDHCGGVAAALSKAGGPAVQKESTALVLQTGKIPVGDVVVTTGGNLKCKRLLHAVGPVGGTAGGEERILLNKIIKFALNLAEIREFESIAMPCISSGASGIPVSVCSEAIVTAVKEFGSQGGRSLSKIILIDNRGEVVRAMHEACDRILQGIMNKNCTPSDLGFYTDSAAKSTTRRDTSGAPGEDVLVEIVQGTIETQQVDAVVCPMVGNDPLSTRVGNTLFKIAGSRLTEGFRKGADEETYPGDAVLVDGLSGLPWDSVFFLSLIPWNEDQNEIAVEVLRLCINKVLTSCEDRGFRSVAFPVLGAGIALRFPDSVVARVLLEEIYAFEQSRASSMPFLVRIAIHPSDKESSEVFKSVQQDITKKVYCPDQGSTPKRIVLLGKTGAGKSSLANTIFGEEIFKTNDSPNSETKKCQVETRLVNGRSITLIDTPGLFDTDRSEEEIRPEIMRCITECAPGPHAFLIVLKVDKFTEQEKTVIDEICSNFSEDTLKYAVIVFTHGDQLPKGKKIEEFISQNKNLSDLVKKCGGRCHPFDNKYWKNKQQNNYRSNQVQVEDLLSTLDKMVMQNNGGYYTNKMLQEVDDEIKKEEDHIKQSSGNIQPAEIRQQAKNTVSKRFLIQLTGTATGALLGVFFGLAAMAALVTTALKSSELMRLMKSVPPLGRAVTAATGGEVALITLGVGAAAAAAAGGVMGGVIGHDAAEGAETVQEAAERACKAVKDKGTSIIKK